MSDWKNEPSALAVEAVSQAEVVGTNMTPSIEDAMTRGADQQREFIAKSAQQFEDANRKFVDGTPEKAQELLVLPNPMTAGLQNMQHSMVILVEGVVRTNLRLAQEVFLVESPRAFLELQQRFLTEYFEAFQKGVAVLTGAADRPA
jgi:hypothetical protein